MLPIFPANLSPLRATASTTALYWVRNFPWRIVLPSIGQVLDTTASIKHRSERGVSSLKTSSVAGCSPLRRCRSTIESIIPIKTRRSLSLKTSFGLTAGIIVRSRIISTTYKPGRFLKPACSILLPDSGLLGGTIISTVYCRTSSVSLITGLRLGNVQG